MIDFAGKDYMPQVEKVENTNSVVQNGVVLNLQ